jgi:hypothetical protein
MPHNRAAPTTYASVFDASFNAHPKGNSTREPIRLQAANNFLWTVRDNGQRACARG